MDTRRVRAVRSALHGLGLNPKRRRFWICYTMGALDALAVVLFIAWWAK